MACVRIVQTRVHGKAVSLFRKPHIEMYNNICNDLKYPELLPFAHSHTAQRQRQYGATCSSVHTLNRIKFIHPTFGNTAND